MNILVVGGGHVGRKVAEELDIHGFEVALIEESEEKLSLLNPNFGGVVFLNFPMDIENLRNAGIENCDAVAVTTSDDNLNITVGQIAKKVFGIENVVSRISDPFREHIFESMGLKTVCPTNMGADSIMAALTSPLEHKTVSFGTNLISFILRPADKRVVDKRLIDVYSGEEEAVMGLIRDGAFIVNAPYNHVKVTLGDNIVFAKKID